MKKLVVATILSTALFASIVSVAGATSPKPAPVIQAKEVDDLISSQSLDVPELTENVKALRKVGQLEDNGWYNKQTKEIDPDKLKEAYLDFFNSNPDKYATSKKNIDSIVQEAIRTNNNSLNTNLNPLLFTPSTIVKLGETWKSGPSLISTENRVHYTTTWLEEDNYRSSVPITVSTTRKSETSIMLGFTGNNLIKSLFGFSASYSVKQEVSVSQGASVPGWTAWAYRPYIRYIVDNYQGVLTTTYTAVPGGAIWEEDTTETGTNKRLTVKANEYWSRVNTTHNTSASTPLPPSGPPL